MLCSKRGVVELWESVGWGGTEKGECGTRMGKMRQGMEWEIGGGMLCGYGQRIDDTTGNSHRSYGLFSLPTSSN